MEEILARSSGSLHQPEVERSSSQLVLFCNVTNTGYSTMGNLINNFVDNNEEKKC